MKRIEVMLPPAKWDTSPLQASPPPALALFQGCPDTLPGPVYIPGWREAL